MCLSWETTLSGSSDFALVSVERALNIHVHILVLNQYFPPDTSATAKMAALVVEALARQHRVTVLAGRPSYDPTERHRFYFLRREQKGNTVVERVGSTTFSRARMRHRLSNYLSYLALAVPRGLAIRSDIVIAMTDPPVAGIAGALIARLLGRPFIYNIRDMYPDMALVGQIVQPSYWTNLWEKFHRWALGQAARVIVLGDDMRDRIIAKGVLPERVVVVRDGAPVPETVPNADHTVAREIRSGFKFVVVHAGNLGFYGAWETLLKAARSLEKEGVGFIFVGDGALRARLEASANGCSSVKFLPFRPAHEVPYVLAAGDLHVVTLKRGLEGVVVPSKLYPILAAGRPVLAVAPEETDVARIVRSAGCGAVADPDNAAEVVERVRELCRDRERLIEMGKRAREIATDYSRAAQLELYVRAIEEVGRKRDEET